MRIAGFGLACVLAVACGAATELDLEESEPSAEPSASTDGPAETRTRTRSEPRPRRPDSARAPERVEPPPEVMRRPLAPPEPEPAEPPAKVVAPQEPEPEPAGEPQPEEPQLQPEDLAPPPTAEPTADETEPEPSPVKRAAESPPPVVEPEPEPEPVAEPAGPTLCVDGQPCFLGPRGPSRFYGLPCGVWGGIEGCIAQLSCYDPVLWFAWADWSEGVPEIIGWGAEAGSIQYHSGYGSRSCPSAQSQILIGGYAEPNYRLPTLTGDGAWLGLASRFHPPANMHCQAIAKLYDPTLFGSLQVASAQGDGLARNDIANAGFHYTWHSTSWLSTGEEVIVKAIVFKAESALLQHLAVECTPAN